MKKTASYAAELRSLADWDAYLLQHSGLPGPRGNLELLQAVVDEGDEARFRHLLTFDPVAAPVNAPAEFLAACGAVGLGKLLASGRMGASGHTDVLADLQALAADPRWRVREGVAMALQRWGEVAMPALLDAMDQWSLGNAYVQRAVVAGLCEPKLLRRPADAGRVLAILDGITARLASSVPRKSEAWRILRQALGYGWSVAIVALPAEGRALMAKWCASSDPDVRWIMRENLKKGRLARLDPAWVEEMLALSANH